MVYSSQPNLSFETDSLEELVAEHAQHPERLLLFVPTRALARTWEEKILRLHPEKSFPEFNFFVPSEFSLSILRVIAPHPLTTLDDSEVAVIIEQSVRDLSDAGKLAYFERSVAERSTMNTGRLPLARGTFELVLNTIRSLRQRGVSVARLKSEIEQSYKSHGITTELRRARDIHAIYQCYEEKTTERHLVDQNSASLRLMGELTESPIRSKQELTTIFGRAFRSLFPDVTNVFYIGFSRLDTPDLHVLQFLTKLDVILLAESKYSESSNSELFERMQEFASSLEVCGLVACPLIETESTTPFETHLCDTLFSFREGTSKIDTRASVSLFSAPSLMEEVDHIGRTIKQLRYDDPALDCSTIVVATPDQARYAPIIREVFSRYGIDCYLTDRHRLDTSHLLIALTSLLEIATHGLRRQEITRALMSPLIDIRNSTGDTIDAHNLRRVSEKYSLTGSLHQWGDKLEGLLQRTHANLQDIETNPDPFTERTLRRELKSFGTALLDIEALDLLLGPFHSSRTVHEFLLLLRSLVTRLNARNHLFEVPAHTFPLDALEFDTRSYRTTLKMFEDLEGLLRTLVGEEEAFPTEFYLERIRSAALLSRFNPRAKRSMVLVTSLEQAAQIPCAHKFIGGLREGLFPSMYEPQIFLMQSLQDGERAQLGDERLLFFQNITQHSQTLHLSYAKSNSGDAAISPFVSALQSVLELDGRQASLAYDTVFSVRDLEYLVSSEHGLEAILANSNGTRRNELQLNETDRIVLQDQIPGAIRVMEQRQRQDKSMFRGYLDPAALTLEDVEFLAKYRDHVYSISQLERYAKCPFSFLLQYVLRVTTDGNPEEGMEVTERGSMVHDILREFLSNRRDRNAPLNKTTAEETEALTNEVVEVANKHIARYAKDHPFWRLDQEVLFGSSRGTSLFRKFIEKEQALGAFYLHPAFFEVSFGNPRTPRNELDSVVYKEEPVEVDGIKLRGKIDRIDVGQNHFAIVDYKTGKTTPNRREIDRGTSLQLPLYLRVAEDLLRMHVDGLEGIAAFYYKVSQQESSVGLGLALDEYAGDAYNKISQNSGGLLKSKEELRTLMDTTIAKAKSYVEGIATGNFPLVAADLQTSVCKYCPYTRSCRVYEAREAGTLV